MFSKDDDQSVPEWMQPNQVSRTWYGKRKATWRKATPKGGYDRFRGYDLLEDDEPEQRQGVDMPASILVLAVVALALSFVPLIKYIAVLFAIVVLVLATREFSRQDPAARIRIKGKDVRDQRFCRIGRFLAVLAIFSVVASSLWAMKEDRDARIKGSGSGTDLVLKQDLSVKFGTFVVGEDAVGAQTRALPVYVENKAGGTCSFEFQVEALDSEGRRIDGQLMFAAKVKGGEEREMQAFGYVDAETTEELKTANFRIAEATSDC